MTEASQPSALPSAPGHEHACLAYESERGFRAVAASFVLAGLRAGERVVCLLHDHEAEELLDVLRERSGSEIDVDGCRDADQLAFVPALDHYAPGGTFDPVDVVRRVSELHDRTLEEGWEGLRVMGEAGWLAERDDDFDAWVRYEWLIEEQLPERLTALCVYPAASLDDEVLEAAMEPHDLRYIDVSATSTRSPGGDAVVVRRWSGELAEVDLGELLTQAVAVVDEAVFVVSVPERTLVACNPAAERMFGYDGEEMVGRPTRELHVDHESWETFGRLTGEVLEHGDECRVRWSMRRSDGSVFPTEHVIRTVSLPERGGSPDLAVSVVRDVSEREARREELERQRERLHQLMGRLLKVQESERRHVARELHDEVGGQLTAVGRSLDALGELVEAGQEASRRVAEARERVGEAMESLRELMESLRPAVLDDLGLVAALRSEIRRRCGSEGLDCRFEADAESYGLRSEVETACFRVGQEALTNVIRHAGAGRVEIDLRRRDDRLALTVRDDGAGFRLNEERDGARDTASLGLLGMRERAEAVGGELRIESAPGEGTRVELTVPAAGER